MEELDEGEIQLDPRYRIIKRYSNRKLYDTRESRYVTLLQVAEMIRDGEEVRVLDNTTKEDKTEVTLALIISEELKSRPRALPLATLEALIRHRGGRVLAQLREGALGRIAWTGTGSVGEGDLAEGSAGGDVDEDVEGALRSAAGGERPFTGSSRGLMATLEQWQQAIDDRVRSVLPSASAVAELQTKVDQLAEQVAELERRVGPREQRDAGDHKE